MGRRVLKQDESITSVSGEHEYRLMWNEIRQHELGLWEGMGVARDGRWEEGSMGLAGLASLEKRDGKTHDGGDVEAGIGSHQENIVGGDGVFSKKGIGEPVVLEIGDGGVGNPCPGAGFGVCSKEVVTGEAEEVNGEADGERPELSESSGAGDGDGGDDGHELKDHEECDEELGELSFVVFEFDGGGLERPFLVNEECEDICEGKGNGQCNGESRGEDPAVEKVTPYGECERYHDGEKGENDDGVVRRVRGGGHNLVSHGEKKGHGPDPERQGNRGGDAEVFADDEGGFGNGFGDDGENGFVFNFLLEHVGGDEDGEEGYAEQDGGEALLDHECVIVIEREAGDVEAEGDERAADHEDDGVNGLSDGLDKRVDGDGESLVEHGYEAQDSVWVIEGLYAASRLMDRAGGEEGYCGRSGVASEFGGGESGMAVGDDVDRPGKGQG